MSYTVVYAKKDECKYFNKPYYNYETLSPYQEYLKNTKVDKVIFSNNNHYGPDICIHHHMILSDKESYMATYVYIYNGDYTHYDVITTILIDNTRKRLFLYDAQIDYRYYAFCSSEKDVKFKGGMKSLLKFYKHEEVEHSAFFEDMKNIFFGSEWTFHRGAKKFIKRKTQEYEHKLNMYEFPQDINYEIWRRLDIYAWLNEPCLRYEDIKDIKEYIDNYVGAPVNTYFRSYIWNKVISVNNSHLI